MEKYLPVCKQNLKEKKFMKKWLLFAKCFWLYISSKIILPTKFVILKKK